MRQFLVKPDPYIRRAGHLDAAVVERHVPGAPAFMRGLRAAFVSDTHVLKRSTRPEIDALAEKIAAASPDILLLGGDYSEQVEDVERLFGALRGVVPPLGGYGVIGNNDAETWKGRLDRLGAVMRKAGCEMLVNGQVHFKHNGGTIWIGGVDEHLHGTPDAQGLYPEAPAPDIYRVLLSHYPVMPAVKPDLLLCGHTHGGQFNLMGLTPFSIGFERFKRPRVSALAVAGLHDIDGVKVFVSKGIGASRLQLRVCVRPEIDLLVFG